MAKRIRTFLFLYPQKRRLKTPILRCQTKSPTPLISAIKGIPLLLIKIFNGLHKKDELAFAWQAAPPEALNEIYEF